MRKFVDLSILAVIAFLALAMAVLPQRALAPNNDHAPGDIERAFLFAKMAPIVTVVLALIALALAYRVWRQPRRPGMRSAILLAGLLALMIVPTLGATLLSRASFAARMFPSLDVEATAAAQEANIADDALVIGIDIAGESRAYPVAVVGYHHIIHDEVGGQAVVATY